MFLKPSRAWNSRLYISCAVASKKQALGSYEMFVCILYTYIYFNISTCANISLLYTVTILFSKSFWMSSKEPERNSWLFGVAFDFIFSGVIYSLVKMKLHAEFQTCSLSGKAPSPLCSSMKPRGCSGLLAKSSNFFCHQESISFVKIKLNVEFQFSPPCPVSALLNVLHGS